MENITFTASATLSNTNNENTVIDGGLDVNAGSGILTLDSTNSAPLRITNTGAATGFRLSDVGGNADLIWENGVGFNFTDQVVINGDSSSETVTIDDYTVAGLPTATQGMKAFVNDATATTFYSVVAGGGSYCVPVFYDGTNWRIG